jgi:anti-sigma factor RsiW
MPNSEQDACGRARYWISLSLDGEISELELQAVRAHLGRCHACWEFERCLSSVTTILREQPFDRMECGVALPPRRRQGVARAGVMSAVAATMVVAAGVFLGPFGSDNAMRTGPIAPSVDTPPADRNDVRELQRQVIRRSLASRGQYAHAYTQRSWIDDL